MVLQQLDIFGNATNVTVKNKPKSSKKRKDDCAILSEKMQKLHELYEKIYDTLDINLFEQREIIIIGNIIAYPEERQAEIMGTQFLDLDERIKVHNDYLEN